MALSTRERYILIGAMGALGVLALDRLVVEPLLDLRDGAESARQAKAAELAHAQDLINQSAHLSPRWNQWTRTGLKSDPAQAESQAMHALRDWAQEAGVELTLLKPERPTDKKRLPSVEVQAAGTGNMQSVAGLLWRIQSASLPIRLSEVQIATRKEGVDDLMVTLKLSTVYKPADAQSTSRPAQASTGGTK